MKNFNLREGLYRLFILMSLYPCCVGFMQSIDSQRLRYVCFGVLGGICVYLSYFVFEWLVSGFFYFNLEHSGIRGIIYRAIDKLKKMNYLLLFVFCLFITISLSYAIYQNLKILSVKDFEIENLQNEVKRFQEIMENPEELSNQLNYINAVKQSELENKKNNEKAQRRFKMLNNIPILPKTREHYYYIETPNYSYNRQQNFESGSSYSDPTSKNEEYRKQREVNDAMMRLEDLEDKVRFMQWGIKTY